jgi:signal transduction histidine kinase
MSINAVRGRGAKPLLTRFIVLCALQIMSAALMVARLVWELAWLPLAAISLAAAAIGVGALVFREGLRWSRALEAVYRELELLGRQRLPDIVKDVVDSKQADGVRLRLAPVADAKLAALINDVEQVCTDAVGVALEYEEIRSGYAEVFVNMFRRTQTLLLRQLQIIEGLEQGDRSSSDLNRFYQLDHLVMRMRRNNENILVLSGTELVRKTKDPVSVDDLLRASISEIDSYQRVRLLSTPSVRVSNTAAGDLIRIVAELLDNATSFSPPDKQVTVKAELARHQGLSIGVIDNGIGMTDADIGKANEQLRKLGSAEIARSRRLGLLVVGRLAGRHGFRVELFGGDGVDGVSALVSVPSSVLQNEDEVRAAMPDDAARIAARGVNANRAGRGESAVPMTVTVRRQDQAGQDGTRVRQPSAWHRRTKAKVPRVKDTNPASDVVAQAHSDVPGELPVRGSDKRVGPSGTEQPVVPRSTSRWFQAKSKARRQESATSKNTRELSRTTGGSVADDWKSNVDHAWQMAEQSNHVQQYTYTEDGLPLRQKGAHLFVGGAEGDPKTQSVKAAKPIERDAEHTQRRLSSYQQGVQKAKEQEARLRGTPHSGGWTILEIDR